MSCSHDRTRVVDSRFRRGYRFRSLECEDCGLRFVAIQIVVANYKKGKRGRRLGVDYDREVERANFIGSLTNEQIRRCQCPSCKRWRALVWKSIPH